MFLHRLQAVLVAALLLPAALPASPYLVKDLNQVPSEDAQEVLLWGMATGPDGMSYFSATDPAHGSELWRSDGTPAGTYRVTDVCAGRCSSYPSSFRIFCEDGRHPRWDGPPEGPLHRRRRPLCTLRPLSRVVPGRLSDFLAPAKTR